ncbi:ABC transporter substrate-binding protein [Mesorhizobium captivum]|uniref:ABC transporter substrate-binding protein n=1 Tax=Mesorhizobium captivum TaxID=3072319 RepID=UPI002A24919D|nr:MULTISPECIES: ABC transporter substrate-binding protein [unclassified Mesorhizobium]MDX8449143.1 ABC transporter substrate-binding protein [Mesorhizobium sp. VK3C]MDX8514634.1 ABC transporter substrate-binding protein [Mesorhizobium sp. VK23E]
MTTNDTLNKILGDGKATRREFLVTAAGLGVAIPVASVMWSNAAKAQPSKGGHLRAGVSGGNVGDSLNPALWTDTFMLSVGATIRDNLTEVAPDNSIRGGVAESWEPSGDATKWVFNLRKGVEFSNGKTLDTDDVISSINLHRGGDSKSGAKGVLAGVQEVVADGKGKVVFKLSSGNADFPFLLSDYHLNILPSKDGKADWQSGIGTGAYVLEEFNPGVKATFKLNPNRWQQDTGFVESADLLGIDDVNARQSAMITGDLEVINKPDLKTIGLFSRNKRIKIVDVPGRIWHAMIMQISTPPYENNDLRMALKYGIDREDYLKKILYGYGTLGNDNPIGKASRYYAADIPQRVYDLDKARYYLKKSGHAASKFDLHAGEVFPGAVDAAVLYQEQAAKAGIDINVVRHPSDGYFSEVWNVLPFCIVWWGPRITEDLILSLAFLSGTPWNDTRISNKKLDELIIGARAELDERKRAEMYRDVQLIISNEGGDVVPAFANLVHAISDKVGVPTDDAGNWKIAGSWELDGGHFLKRWWLNG